MKPEDVNCALCETRHTIKIAEAWCSMCQKGFCNKCRYNHLSNRKNRGHKFITVEKYQKQTAPESAICKTHENKSHYYCKSHDEVVCVVCSPETHKACAAFSTLHAAAKELKLSTVTMEFDKTIKALAGNIQKVIVNRTKNLTSMKDRKIKIEDEITSLRNNINDKLNKVQDELLQDLQKTFQKQKHEIEECLKTLDKSKKEMQNLKEQSVMLNQSPSTSIHNFLRTLQMRTKFKEEETAVTDAIKNTKPTTLVLKHAPGLQTFYDEVVEFGNIEVQKGGSNKKTPEQQTKPKNGPKSNTKSLEKLKVELRESVKKPSGHQGFIKNCVFKSDGQMVFTEPENKMIVVYDKKGSFVTSITVPGHPFDIAAINYCTVAVTFEKQNSIQILDTTYQKVSKTIHAKNMCRGISYMNGQLFVVVKDEGIMILDTLGQIKKILPINVADVRFLSASNSRLCFTNEITREVSCCDLRGKIIWTFKEKSVECPQGITLDSVGIVFVLGSNAVDTETESPSESSYSVVAIAPDGSSSKVVLKRPGRPSGVDYDKKHKRLVLYSLDGSADLYAVI
ncbi:Hypothetical predicted protein [Mytilus galloprovincialis]|uniref:B box-type domain-containing protein n=1 Tax=Mytilus galloprovincialis TaxID=29158 RepID=A0A8B6G7D4_MYTGA|nr:Hypothetical predicted protein [Mytilus galloprovincialis]